MSSPEQGSQLEQSVRVEPTDPRQVFEALTSLADVHSDHVIPLLRAMVDYTKGHPMDETSIGGMLEAAGVSSTQEASARIISQIAYVGYYWGRDQVKPYGVDTDDLPQSRFTDALIRGVKVARYVEQHQDDPSKPAIDTVFQGLHLQNRRGDPDKPRPGRTPKNKKEE